MCTLVWVSVCTDHYILCHVLYPPPRYHVSMSQVWSREIRYILLKCVVIEVKWTTAVVLSYFRSCCYSARRSMRVGTPIQRRDCQPSAWRHVCLSSVIHHPSQTSPSPLFPAHQMLRRKWAWSRSHLMHTKPLRVHCVNVVHKLRSAEPGPNGESSSRWITQFRIRGQRLNHCSSAQITVEPGSKSNFSRVHSWTKLVQRVVRLTAWLWCWLRMFADSVSAVM